MSELNALAAAAASVPADRVEIRRLDTLVSGCRTRLHDLAVRQLSTASKLAEQIKHHDILTRKVDRLQRNETKVAELVSRLSAHVESASCPLCGHDHGTQEELVARITGQPDRNSARLALHAEITRSHTDKEDLEALLEQINEGSLSEKRSIDASVHARTSIIKRISHLEETAAQFGFMFSDERPVIDQIQQLLAREQSQVRQMQLEAAALHDQIGRQQIAFGDLDKNIEAATTALNDSQVDMDACQHEIQQLRHDSPGQQLSLETPLEQLEQLHQRNQEQLREVDFALNEALAEQQKHDELASAHRQHASALESTLATIRREIAIRRRVESDTNARLVASGLSLEATEPDVENLLEEAMKESNAIAILSDFADSVEFAVDTATTAAALRQQREQIQKKTREISILEQQIGLHEMWGNAFSELADLLSAKQNAAITNFAVAYGPMASAIQQRLRSVYGFHGIETRGHEATIQVRVRRGDKILRPTDYFSPRLSDTAAN